MAFLPEKIDRPYITAMTMVWLAVVSAAYTYCHMHTWVYEYAADDPNAPNIWLLSRWMFWPLVLPLSFCVLRLISKRTNLVFGLIGSAVTALILATLHANTVNNFVGYEESLIGTFYYMTPIVLGSYTLFVAVSLGYVRKYPDETITKPREEQTLVVNKGRTIVWLKESEVDWMQAARNYVDVHADGQTYILRNTLSKMEEALENDSFIRIHRSYIVNRNSIEGVNKNRDGSALVIMKDGSELPCGRAHWEALSTAS